MPHYQIRDTLEKHAAKKREQMVKRHNAHIQFERFGVGRIVGVFIDVKLRKKLRIGVSLLPAIVCSVSGDAGVEETSKLRYTLRYACLHCRYFCCHTHGRLLRCLYGELEGEFPPWQVFKLPQASFSAFTELLDTSLPKRVSMEQALALFAAESMSLHYRLTRSTHWLITVSFVYRALVQ